MFAKRLSALLLAAAMAISLAAPRAQASHYEDAEHSDTAFEDMLVTGISRAGVDEFCRRFAADPAGEYENLLNLFDGLETQVALLGILSDCNAGDEAASYDYEQAQNDRDYAVDRLYAAISDALAGEHGDALRALMPEGEADSFADYAAQSAEELESDAEVAALVQDYFLLPVDDAFYTHTAAELYLKLAALRREQAEREGFDSFADYAYASFYAREYVPEDAQHLHRAVKSYLAPLYADSVAALANTELPWDDEDVPGGDEIVETLAAHMGDVSPELNEAMDALRRNGLYRIGSEENLQDLGYTIALPAYRSAFLFNKVDTRANAFQSTVHEFGHFNAAWHDSTPALYQYDNLDVNEVQSQGLEMLFLPCLQDILAPDGSDADRAAVALYAVTELLGAVVDGCMYDEFEQAVYADPTLTVEDLHALEAKLNTEYGLDGIYEQVIYWPYISHLFAQPFYYISYAVSALPALDLWLLSLRDRDAAVEAYLNISAARTDEWFLDVMEENGLCDVTNRGDVVRLSDALEQELGSLKDELPASASDVVFLALACLLPVTLGVCIVLIVRRRRRRAAAVTEPMEFP